MQLSDCLFINSLGILLYQGAHGVLYEVAGGTGKQLNLRKLN